MESLKMNESDKRKALKIGSKMDDGDFDLDESENAFLVKWSDNKEYRELMNGGPLQNDSAVEDESSLDFELIGERLKNLKQKPADNVLVLEGVEVLDGVVKGDFTLQDIHTAREGAEAAMSKDPIENSPLQLLDDMVESMKRKSHKTFQTIKDNEFFGGSVEDISRIMNPMVKSDAINQAAIAVDIFGGTQVNIEASEAILSLVRCEVMNEAEMKINRQEERAKNAAGKTAEAENSSGAEASQQKTQAPYDLPNFNVTDLNFDISFMPSDDPDCYKPLEIISYMGMTENLTN